MKFLYEELEYYSDGGCGGSNVKKQDPAKKPVGRAIWDTFIYIENKYVSVTDRKWPHATLDSITNEPIIVWEEERKLSDDWDKFLSDGFGHTRVEQSHDEKWTRKVTRGGWFVEFDTIEDFINHFMNRSGVEIFVSDNKYVGSEDKKFWIQTIRCGLIGGE